MSEGPPIDDVLKRNVQALMDVQRKYEAERTREEKIADRITHFVGSMTFVYLHLLLFGSWIVLNSGLWPDFSPLDPFPFVMLAMFASVEAIFVSTIVLISQNRMGQLAEKRAELDVQVSLLIEHELTQLIALVDQMARRLKIDTRKMGSLEEIKKDLPPNEVLERIEEIQREGESAQSQP